MKLNNIMKCLQNKRLQWFDNLKRIGESALSSKYGTLKVGGSFSRGLLKKTWSEVIRSGPKGRKGSKEVAKDLEFIHEKQHSFLILKLIKRFDSLSHWSLSLFLKTSENRRFADILGIIKRDQWPEMGK